MGAAMLYSLAREILEVAVLILLFVALVKYLRSGKS